MITRRNLFSTISGWVLGIFGFKLNELKVDPTKVIDAEGLGKAIGFYLQQAIENPKIVKKSSRMNLPREMSMGDLLVRPYIMTPELGKLLESLDGILHITVSVELCHKCHRVSSMKLERSGESCRYSYRKECEYCGADLFETFHTDKLVVSELESVS